MEEEPTKGKGQGQEVEGSGSLLFAFHHSLIFVS